MAERVLEDFKPGDTVRVYYKVVEGDKEREQAFEGVVIAKRHGSEPGATFTVRKVSYGIGVERIFLAGSPSLTRLQRVRQGKVRRAKLSYLRELKGRQARIREKRAGVEGEAE